MTRIGVCQACKVGDHSKHQTIVKKGIPGMIGGGVVCGCKGDCKERFQAYIARRVQQRKQAFE